LCRYGKKYTTPAIEVIHSVTSAINRVGLEDMYGVCPVCENCYGHAPFDPEEDMLLRGETCVVCGKWFCTNCRSMLCASPVEEGQVPVCNGCRDKFNEFIERRKE
jgi:hypothetical protein